MTYNCPPCSIPQRATCPSSCGKFFSHVSEEEEEVWSLKCNTADITEHLTPVSKWQFDESEMNVSAVGTSTELLKQQLWFREDLQWLRVMPSVRSANPPHKQLGVFLTWHLVWSRLGCLNIRSHPKAWDWSPPEAANPVWAAALCLERAYRVSWHGYSHRGRVSFRVRSSLAFVYDKLSCAPSNQMHVWWSDWLP